ncbi:MAG: hypothetical protein ACRDZ3_20340 [Acidimicrobiia bacterium]
MGPVAVRTRNHRLGLAILAGLLAVAAGACQGAKGPEVTDANRTFPLPAETDLMIRLVPDAPRPEVRRVTTELVLEDGVEATEAHYDNREIRVVVSRDMSPEHRRRLRSKLLESPVVAAVEVRPPED